MSDTHTQIVQWLLDTRGLWIPDGSPLKVKDLPEQV